MLEDREYMKKMGLAVFIGILAGFTNGFLGAGGGILLLWLLNKLNPDKTAVGVRNNFAAVVAVVLLLSIASAVSYSSRGNVDTDTLLPLILPGALGGVFGAFLTDKLNVTILKLAFCTLMIIAGINMIF